MSLDELLDSTDHALFHVESNNSSSDVKSWGK